MPKTLPTAPVDINTASLEELKGLPGVGPSLARRIVAARPYQSLRDLVMVDGIGPKLYASLLPLITVAAERKKPRRAAAKAVAETATPEAAAAEATAAEAAVPEAIATETVVPEASTVMAEAPVATVPEEPAPPETTAALSLSAALEALLGTIPAGCAESAVARALETPAGLPTLLFEPAMGETVGVSVPAAPPASPLEAPAGIPLPQPEIPAAEPLESAAPETVISAPAVLAQETVISAPVALAQETVIAAPVAPAQENVISTPAEKAREAPGRDRFAELERDVEPEVTVWTPVEAEAPTPQPAPSAAKPAPPVRFGAAPTAKPAPATAPAGKPKVQTSIPLKGAGTYPLRTGIYAGNMRRRYPMPVNTRLRIALGVFYGIIGIALIGLTYLVVVYVRSAGQRAAPTASTAAATAPASATAVSAAPATAVTPTSTRPASTATSTASPTVAPTITASPTVTLTPTIAPTSPAGAGQVIFIETFEAAPYAWRGLGSIDFSTTTVTDGQMIFTTSRPYLAFWPGNREYLGDIYMQATAKVGDCKGTDHYGLQVRAMDAANFYLFGVQCDGKVRIQVREGWNYRTIVAGQAPAAAVKTGSGAENVLAVRVLGNEFRFFANGELLNMFTDSTFRDGKIGIYGRAAETSMLTVAFDDVFVWQAVP
jgi:hypothetical protein